MTAGILAMIALAGAGCAMSGGTATVGMWRPQRVVDTQVCIESSPGVCAKTLEVGRDVPARSFAGGMFAWFNPGYAFVSGSDARHRFVLNSQIDYLRGRGGFALGGRVGGNLAFGGNNLLFTVPVSVLGYWGYPWASVYAGGGYTPYATEAYSDDGKTRMSTRSHGPHLIAGTRIVLRTGRAFRLSTSVEVARQYLGDLTITSSTMNIGLHF